MRIKHFLILAAAAGMALSCISNFEATPTQQAEIGFGTWAEQLTKAARVPGSSSFTESGYTENDFAVYGYKDKSTPNTATVFDDIVVSTTNGTTWTYSPHRFWDTSYDSYTFFAISPATVGTEADGTNSSQDVNPQTGAFVTRSITFGGADNDILVADKKTVEKGNDAPYFNSYGIVPLVFNHVASLVDIKVKKSSNLSDATVTISSFQLSDIDNAGQLTVTDAYTDTHPVASWSTGTRGTYGPESGVIQVKVDNSGNYEANGTNSIGTDHPIIILEDNAFNPSNPSTPAASTILVNNLVVKPQTFRASNESNPQKITLSYRITVEEGVYNDYQDCVLYLYDFDNVDDADQNDTKVASWDPGKHYTFFITIDANAINFSATITNWTSVSGYHYLVAD